METKKLKNDKPFEDEELSVKTKKAKAELSDEAIYSEVVELQGKVQAEMSRRKKAGEKGSGHSLVGLNAHLLGALNATRRLGNGGRSKRVAS